MISLEVSHECFDPTCPPTLFSDVLDDPRMDFTCPCGKRYQRVGNELDQMVIIVTYRGWDFQA